MAAPSSPPEARVSRDAPHGAVRAWRPAWAWTGDELVRAPVVAVDGDGRLVEHRGEPVEDLPGLLMPGLVNVHTHLELGPLVFPPGLGLPAWVPLVRMNRPTVAQGGQSALAAIRFGTAALGDVTNTGASADVLRSARMPGRVFHELIGIDVDELPPVSGRAVPHAPHTAHEALVRACAALPGPWTIHFDEDPAEAAFLRGEGPWIGMMRAFGRDLSRFRFPGLSPARYLASLGVLSPRTLLVHATCTRGDDLDVVAASGARVALCVRSNLALTGALPDVPGMLARGIPLTIGTDSLASVADLDPLAELAALVRQFPAVPVETWLRALTAGGADALALPMGRLRIGEAPGLLHLAGEGLDAVLSPGRRRWLACPGA